MCFIKKGFIESRGGSRTAATSKMELFVTIVNDFQLQCCSSPRSASGKSFHIVSEGSSDWVFRYSPKCGQVLEIRGYPRQKQVA